MTINRKELRLLVPELNSNQFDRLVRYIEAYKEKPVAKCAIGRGIPY